MSAITPRGQGVWVIVSRLAEAYGASQERAASIADQVMQEFGFRQVDRESAAELCDRVRQLHLDTESTSGVSCEADAAVMPGRAPAN